MNAEWMQAVVFFAVLLIVGGPLGLYMAGIFDGHSYRLMKPLDMVEKGIYRLLKTDPNKEMNWKGYSLALLLFNGAGLTMLFVLLRLQGILPLNPSGFSGVPSDGAFNIAVSFITNTNWQWYGGESTLSLLSQMMGLCVQNFLSAASGMAVLLVLARGFSRHGTDRVGNFWVDLTRTVLYVLFPLSFVLSIALIWQGVPQTLSAPIEVNLLESAGGVPSVQNLPLGPVASQVAIKQLGSNGGGFYNVNSAHPFENPTPLSNLLQMLSILLIPVAQCFMFGRIIRDQRQGFALFSAMALIFLPFFLFCWWAETHPTPVLAKNGVELSTGNLEGKELRFGIMNSALWATATTATSNGSVNAMHDSFTPLGGLVPLLLMQLGEVVFGGVGCGLYGMLAFAILTVFIAGLLVGRTPEYLQKKIGIFEMKMSVLVVLIPPAGILLCTALGVNSKEVLSGLSNPGPHGFSQILYAFSSMCNNNGSAFAGFGSNTPFVNILGGMAMLVCRFGLILAILAMASSLSKAQKIPVGAGTLPTHTPLFISLLIVVILVVGALAFFPSLILGPIAEHFLMKGG